jgi:hypothetical protein
VPFERVLGPQIGAALKTLHENNNVRLQMESFLDHFKPSSKHRVSLSPHSWNNACMR